MSSRVSIFDHFCRPLTEINAPVTPRSWVLNDFGRAEFSIGFDSTKSQSEQLLREEYFQFGNLIHIVHLPSKDGSGTQNGMLPDWTGIILPPRKWDLGVCHITAYSAESILKLRALKYKNISGTPKTVLKQMIEIVNERAKNIQFKYGNLDDLQLTFPDILRTNAYDHIKKLQQNSKMDWDVTGRIDNNGLLNLYVNLYNKKGQILNVLLDNKNTELGSPLLEEQGTPHNQIFGYSQAQTSQSRFGPIEAVNQSSIDDYGPFQLNQVLIGKKDPTSVGNSVQSLADSRGRPVKLIKRIALDKGDLFSMLETGNVLNIKDINVGFNNGFYGFDSTARIISMDYNDLSNKVPLNIEVI